MGQASYGLGLSLEESGGVGRHQALFDLPTIQIGKLRQQALIPVHVLHVSASLIVSLRQGPAFLGPSRGPSLFSPG